MNSKTGSTGSLCSAEQSSLRTPVLYFGAFVMLHMEHLQINKVLQPESSFTLPLLSFG